MSRTGLQQVLDATRRAAFCRKSGRRRARVGLTGLPSRRREAWRFTDLGRIEKLLPGLAKSGSEAGLDALVGAIDGPLLVVLVDGAIDPRHSRLGGLPAGTMLTSFARWSAEDPAEAAALFDQPDGADDALRHLNAACFTDGLALIVPPGAALPAPIQVLHWNGGVSAQTRHLIRLGAGSRASVIEHHAGIGTGWTNSVTSVFLGNQAVLSHARIQDEAVETGHTSHLAVNLAAKAVLDSHVLTLGGGLSRADLAIDLAGPGAVARLSGATLLSGTQDSTSATLVRHGATDGSSRQVFKYCLDGQSHGVFQGRIAVAEHAQKTDAHQTTRAVLLSDRATMNAKPELEILADDVKCSHGAALGDLDETAMFYCRSRGIPPDEARRLLIAAFLAEAVDEIADAPVRAAVATSLERGLARHGRGAS